MDTVYGGLAASVVNLLTGIHFVVHTHGIRARFMNETSNDRASDSVDFMVEKIVTKRCSFLISVNKEGKDFWVNHGVSSAKIQIIPVPVDTARFQPNPRMRKSLRLAFGVEENQLVFGYVGRLSEEKISTYLLQAFFDSGLDAKLVIVGDGPLMGELKGYAQSSNYANRVIFTGFRSDVNQLLNIFDVFVLPSRIEGLPTVVLEAFSNGKAVIASNIAANKELVTDSVDGVLFDRTINQDLRGKMIQLAENALLRSKIAENGFRKASRYDISVVLSSLFALYDRL